MLIKHVVAAPGALMLASARLLDRCALECREAHRALTRPRDRCWMRLVGPDAWIKVPCVKLWANFYAVTLVVRNSPHGQPFIDPGWDLANAHVWRVEVDRIAAHRNDRGFGICANQFWE